MSLKRRAIGARWLALRWLALAPALLALVPVAAGAADLRQGSEITVPAGTTVSDDLYATGGRVTMAGTIAGTLTAAAGTIDVTGTVEDDVIVTGGTVTISGPVMGTVRAAGGTVTVSGPVAEDAVLGGGTLTVQPGATIGRDLVVGAGTATVAGRVGRDLKAAAGTLDLRGQVQRDVHAEVTNLRVADGATIGGNLDYASDNQATIDSGATVSGTVTHTPANVAARPTPAQRATDLVVGWIRLLVGMFALGLLLVLPFGAFSRRASDTIGGSPLASLGLGLAILIGVPIAALIVFVLGLLAGGWPLGLAAMALLAIATAIGYVLSALFIGRGGFRLLGSAGVHPLLALLVGLVILILAGSIPFVGGLIDLAAVVFGLGALTLALFRSWREPTPTGPTPAPAQQPAPSS